MEGGGVVFGLIHESPYILIIDWLYLDKILQCITSTQELIGIHNHTAPKSWSKYTTDIKVGKVNYNKMQLKK